MQTLAIESALTAQPPPEVAASPSGRVRSHHPLTRPTSDGRCHGEYLTYLPTSRSAAAAQHVRSPHRHHKSRSSRNHPRNHLSDIPHTQKRQIAARMGQSRQSRRYLPAKSYRCARQAHTSHPRYQAPTPRSCNPPWLYSELCGCPESAWGVCATAKTVIASRVLGLGLITALYRPAQPSLPEQPRLSLIGYGPDLGSRDGFQSWVPKGLSLFQIAKYERQRSGAHRDYAQVRRVPDNSARD